MTRTRMGLALIGALALMLAMAACGGGGGGGGGGKTGGVASLGGDKPTATTSPGGGDSTQEALAFARCMRQHGINMPDPKITAEGIDQPPAPGVHRDDPRATAAEQACSPSRGGGK
jgi:hypothetical protein